MLLCKSGSESMHCIKVMIDQSVIKLNAEKESVRAIHVLLFWCPSSRCQKIKKRQN